MAASTSKCINQLHTMLVQLPKYKTSIYAEKDGHIRETEITADKNAEFIHVYLLERPEVRQYEHFRPESIACAFEQVAQLLAGATALTETVMVFQESAVSVQNELYKVSRDAWCEALGCAAPLADVAPLQSRKSILRNNLWPLLTGGEPGIGRWNYRPKAEIAFVDWRNTDASELFLNQANFDTLNFSGAKFDGGQLQNSSFEKATLHDTSFCTANLCKADLRYAKAQSANFRGATLKQAKLEGAVLSKALFTDSDLTQADLRYCDLRGADLTGATVVDAHFEKAIYDQNTILPESFPQWSKLTWKGTASDPFKTSLRESLKDVNVTEFDDFIQRLQAHFDHARLANAFKMLKKERFQLFAQVNERSLSGVVKSQTDPDLVYACRLSNDGTFSCCTQNLRACGGLRGALCKHLLVLIIGLARAGELDLAQAFRAVLASTVEKPVMDKDDVTDIFFKYKGSQAGEIDWRPTETVPEDYYAF